MGNGIRGLRSSCRTSWREAASFRAENRHLYDNRNGKNCDADRAHPLEVSVRQRGIAQAE